VLLSSVLTAIANVTYKYALEEFEFWDLFIIRSLGLGSVLILAGWHSGILSDVRQLVSDKIGFRLFVITELVAAPVAVMTMLAALSSGPVAIVSTVISTRSLLVLIISGLLSTNLWPVLDEPLTKDTLPLKFISTILIVGGVGVLTLG